MALDAEYYAAPSGLKYLLASIPGASLPSAPGYYISRLQRENQSSLRYGRSRFLYLLIQIVDLKTDRTGAGASDTVEDAHDFAVRN